ncbi:MAG TPA: cation:proton antiporter [Longimicrobium sp.]|jgi:CPA2 family monovalent cation:H+ antiporter-2|uniref:cation:proton antiporter n=1 Tax=Longimicrobium sp. TaxID=2029185 RepID=UPI002ED9DF96
MHGEFLLGAGAVLAALALAGLLFDRLRQSVIPAFILLGMAIRPLDVDAHLVEVLATLGVVLLLFFMGLEFSVGALLRDRRRIVRNGGIDLLVSFPVGFAGGLWIGGGWTGALLMGGAFYVSSSAIIAKSTIEMRRSANPETEVALGVLVFEDLFMALFLALLSGAVLSDEPSAQAALWGMGKAVAFFAAVVGLALYGRRLLDRLFDLDNDDLFLLFTGGVVLLLSWGALAAGLSEAIGAFLAGLLLAETEHKERAERLFGPLQGLFAAVFFLGFGLSLDPASFAGVWPYALVLAVAGTALKIAAGMWIGRRDGLPKRNALALGLTLVPRGEFSILLAGIAVTANREAVGATIALLVLALSLVGTVGLRFAPEIARWVYPRKPGRSLEERGFSPGLAAFDEPPAK